MTSLALYELADIQRWLSSPLHATFGVFCILIAAFIIFAVIVNIPDLVRTVKIHMM
jgi:hypothetical protein